MYVVPARDSPSILVSPYLSITMPYIIQFLLCLLLSYPASAWPGSLAPKLSSLPSPADVSVTKNAALWLGFAVSILSLLAMAKAAVLWMCPGCERRRGNVQDRLHPDDLVVVTEALLRRLEEFLNEARKQADSRRSDPEQQGPNTGAPRPGTDRLQEAGPDQQGPNTGTSTGNPPSDGVRG